MKSDFTSKTIFAPKLNISEEDTISFKILAAKCGLTPERLLECFVCDVVSSFSSDEITIEQSHLIEWFNNSWFSQDKDGYFSFLQFILLNKQYENTIVLLNENSSRAKKILLELFDKYCTKNPAHKSFDEEINNVLDFSVRVYIKHR